MTAYTVCQQGIVFRVIFKKAVCRDKGESSRNNSKSGVKVRKDACFNLIQKNENTIHPKDSLRILSAGKLSSGLQLRASG